MSAPVRRLLMTADAVGGVWQYALDLSRALGTRGIETMLAVLGPAPTPGQRREARAIPGLRLIETALPLDWLCDSAAPVRAAADAIADLAHETEADLVQLNMPTLAVAGFDVPTIAVTHGCVATWWAAAKPGQSLHRDYRWHRTLTAEGLAAADRVVAPSAAYAATVAAAYGLAATPTVVHNGRRPLPALRPQAMHDCALTVGRLWDPVKGAALLDRVAARLAVPFHAAGAADGPHGERFVARNLHQLGQLDARGLARRLGARPVFVSAAAFEPFGLAVLEAAQAGCALVLADHDVFRELWDGAAIFVPPDADAYLAAIDGLIGDAAARIAFGEAARVRAACFTPDAMAGRMAAL